MQVSWDKWADRLFVVLVVAACLFWASRNSDPGKVDALEAKHNAAMEQINQFGRDMQTRVTALEQKVIPGGQQQQQQPGPVAKK